MEVEGACTPLLHVSDMLTLTLQPTAVLSRLRGTEKCLSRDTEKAEAYQVEITRPEKMGYTTRVGQARTSKEFWFICPSPSDSQLEEVVFNFSFTYRD